MAKKKKTFAEIKKEAVSKKIEKDFKVTADNSYPKISIVTPSYNQGQFLEECIESILGQNYPNLEYVIMDGGSTDNSVDIIKKYERCLTYWQSQPDNGQYHAINEGFRKTTGEIMAWLNSDDKYHPHALFKAAYVFNKFNTIDWLTGRPSIWDKYGHLESMEPTQPIWSRLMYLQLTVRKPIQQESTFWRRSLWEKTGSGLRVEFNFAADLELWLRFFQYVQHYSVNTLLGGYRMHGNQKAQLYKDKYINESMKILADTIALYNESEDKSLLPVPPVLEVPEEIYNYMNCMDAKKILDKSCWRYYRNDLEVLKRIAESQSLHDASRLLNAELSHLTRIPL